MNNGILVISLDLEMMWGCHDWCTVKDYGLTNIQNVRLVITRMIDLFKKYDVHATFASVGLLMCSNEYEALKYRPEIVPHYVNKKLSPYKSGLIEDISSQNRELFYGSDIIDKLKRTNGIEIGTHTFSHYYCWEQGQTIEDFDADLTQSVKIAESKGINLRSIIFPKNNVDTRYLPVVSKHNITCYRGNPKRFFSNPESRIADIVQRISRLLDNYLPLTNNCYSPSELNRLEDPMNIPASRFFRPYYPKLKYFESLKIKRITNEIKNAAKKGLIYHLWWHPHNFGANVDYNLSELEQVLSCFKECSKSMGMKSLNMGELYSIIKNQSL